MKFLEETMAEHQLNDFKSTIKENGNVEFSFKLEDKGPGVAWPGKNPVIAATAKQGPFGELLIEGVISEGEAPKKAKKE